jgi:hypothetical protein
MDPVRSRQDCTAQLREQVYEQRLIGSPWPCIIVRRLNSLSCSESASALLRRGVLHACCTCSDAFSVSRLRTTISNAQVVFFFATAFLCRDTNLPLASTGILHPSILLSLHMSRV